MDSYPRQRAMEIASFSLGLASIFLICNAGLAIFTGALAILFAYLSRGGNKTYSKQSRLGLFLGLAGIIVSVCITAYVIISGVLEYGSLAAFSKATYEPWFSSLAKLLGIDYETLINYLGLTDLYELGYL